MNSNNRLGRGLNSLLGEKRLNMNNGMINTDRKSVKVQEMPVDFLIPNKFQPRKFFDKDELNELTLSIKEYGILQPIVVRKTPDVSVFEIIAGERRFRAAKLANLNIVPVIVKDFSDKDSLSLAIIENIQRSDLSAIEEAEAYKSLIDDFNYTQHDVSIFVGKSRSHIANILRLLELPTEVKKMVQEKQLTMGHARTLIGCDKALEISRIIIDENLSVRETEKMVKEYKENLENNPKLKQTIKKAQFNMISEEYFKKIENGLSKKIKLKSKINFNPSKKVGKITIIYNSIEELEEFLKKLK